MARPVGVAMLAVDAQVAIHELARRQGAPLYEAAMRSGDFAVMAEAKALAATLRVARLQAKRIAGLADGIACPDGIAGLWHGRAA